MTNNTPQGLDNNPTDAMFTGGLSFMRCPVSTDYAQSDVAMVGIGFDSACSGRPGTRLGPRGVRVASTMLSWDRCYGWGDLDVFKTHTVIDGGDIPLDYGQPKYVHQSIHSHITHILNKHCATLCIGGDHYITYPIIQAYAEKYGSMSLVHFDAHTDTWADDDDRTDHGTMLYKAIKQGYIDVDTSIQVGIRTCNDHTMGIKIIDAPAYHKSSPTAVAQEILKRVGNRPVYITFDIDCLDPACAPGTGTPVIGGLSTAQALETLRALGALNLVGMDVVEVSPPYDHADITSLAGATIARELLQIFASKTP